MDYERWMNKARNTIALRVELGAAFTVKSLFEGVEWETLSVGDRKQFGRYFSNEVNENHVIGVVKVGNTKAHHTLYMKVED